MTKLHLGCGSVYLSGFVNVDVLQGPRVHFASERPDLVDRWVTTEDKYYARQPPFDLHTTRDSEIVVDESHDICNLPHEPGSVEKILVVQVFEHLTRIQTHQALTCWHRVLLRGGILHIDVPDIEKTAGLLLDADTREKRMVALRLIFGTRKDAYSYHHFGYTPAGLSRLLSEHGFSTRQIEPMQDDYPAFAMMGVKI